MRYSQLKPGVIMAKTTVKSNRARAASAGTQSVAQVLERERDPLIHEWLAWMEKQEGLMTIPLSYEDRTGHLPQLLANVIARLRLDSSMKTPTSLAASRHGDLRRKQGYSVAMVVEESRLLQVCFFSTLHKNTKQLNYEKLLPDVVTLADEVDAQLKQQMLRYMTANAVGTKPKVH
jgi:hypothetical protein